jgi:hypothetical protein
MMKNNNQVEWILIEDKLKKEEEDNKIINFKEAAKRIKKL